MTIHNIAFPLPLSFGARGGPYRQTEIVQLASGHEQRNSHLSQSRRRYEVGAGVKSLDDMHSLLSFYEARFGQLYGFLFKDPLDHKSCLPSSQIGALDQIIGIGDGTTKAFNLTKSYGDDEGGYSRKILYPKVDSLIVFVDGQPAAASWDDSLKQIVLALPPSQGSQISAGFEFDVPVRFDTDQLDLSIESFGAGKAINIPLIEVLAHD